MKTEPQANLEFELRTAELKAWDSLARYKFQMFGYWAAIWVHLNRIGNFNQPNPFKSLVHAARRQPWCNKVAAELEETKSL